MENQNADKYLNRNVKLFPCVNALAWDILFVWTISTMFFTNVKGLSNSQVIMLDSFLMLFGCLFCIPISKIFEKVNSVTSTRIGLLGYVAYILIVIFSPKGCFPLFVLAQPFLAFGYAIESVKTNQILVNSLAIQNRDKEYQKVYGKSMFLFYLMEAIGAIAVTYAYSWNPYSAFWLSLGMIVIAEILLIFVKEPTKFQARNISIEGKTETKKGKPDSYFKIIGSFFFLSLLIYMFFFRGMMSIVGSAFKVYLQQLTSNNSIPIWSFGYIYAVYKLGTAISSKFQFKIDLKFGVRSILLFLIGAILTFALTGALYLINPYSVPIIIAIILLTYLQGTFRIPNGIFMNNYMQICIPKKNIERAYAIRTTVEYLGYAIISGVYAQLLGVFNDNYGLTNLVYIGILILPLCISCGFFIRALIKQYSRKRTIIKKEYTED